MTTRIVSGGPSPQVDRTHTAPRVTPAPNQPFRSVMQASARAVVDTAESAVTRLPGGPVLAAAFRSEPSVRTTHSALVTAGDTAEGPQSSYASGSAPDGLSVQGDEMTLNTQENMYYLKLQQQISDESRQYTALSNVLKARHDMVKNAIGNIR